MYTEITHITKPRPHDPHERIHEVGAMSGATVLWRCNLDEAIVRAKSGANQYYVNRGGRWVLVEVVEGGLLQLPYLRTIPDLTGANNLLSLPQLPYANALLLGAMAARTGGGLRGMF